MTGSGFRVSVLSKVGGRERNEDACGYWAGGGSPLACYVLADGAGGHGGGDVASRIAVQSVLDQYASLPQASPASVLQLLAGANNSIMRRQRLDPRLADMRSTMVLLEVDAQRLCAFWGHVGDSRLYCFKQGRVTMRTKDHSLVQNMLDAGLARPGSAVSSSDRNVLTSSLGGEDCFSPSTSDQPYPIGDGSVFLLCSDGFWSALGDRDMESSLQNSDTPDSWLRAMEHVFIDRLRPGADNYSAIALWYCDESEHTRALETGRPHS